MNRRLPPFPSGDLNAWALQLVEYLQEPSVGREATVSPQSVLLQHQSTTTMERASVDGILMWDANLKSAVFSKDGTWIPFSNLVSLIYTVDGTGNVEDDVNAMDFTGQEGANGTCAECPSGGITFFFHDGIQYLYAGPSPASYGSGCADTALASYFKPTGVAEFIKLADTPASYVGETGKFVKVNSGPDGLEFAVLTESDISDLDKYTQAEADAKFIDASGDTMIGPLFLNGTPSEPVNVLTAVNADYVGIRMWEQKYSYVFDDGVWFEGTAYHCIVANVAAGTPFSLDDWRPISANIGTALQLNYKWTTSTAGQVPDGTYGMNNADPTLATQIRVSVNTSVGFDVASYWASVNEGDIIIFEENTGGAEWVVNLAENPGVLISGTPDYYEIEASYLGNDGVPEDNRAGTVSIISNPASRLPSGGDTGDVLTKQSATIYDSAWETSDHLLYGPKHTDVVTTTPPVLGSGLVYTSSNAWEALNLWVAAGYGGVLYRDAPLPIANIDSGWTVLEADTDTITVPRGVTQDVAGNGLEFDIAGVWRLSISASLSFVGVNSGRYFLVRLYNVTQAVAGRSTRVDVGRNTEGAKIALNNLVEIADAQTGDLWRVEIGGTVDTFTSVLENTFSIAINLVSEFRG